MDRIEKETTYTFRFGTSDKTIQLTQQQLDHFPYLNDIVTHPHCFSSTQNEDGEYVLNDRIRYSWFMAIFRSIINEKPSALFTKLSQDENVLSMLHLYDYLWINPLPVPLLKGKHLVRLNASANTNEKTRIEYRRAKNLTEVRDTAVLFIISLTKNEYNFNDFKTLKNIFSLIMIIRSKLNIFGSRLCHHMFTIVKEYCFTFFSRDQQLELCNAQRSIQNNKSNQSVFMCNDDQPLPDNFPNAFAWKGVYVPIKENENIDCQSNYNKQLTGGLRSGRFNLWKDKILSTKFRGTELLYVPMTEYYNMKWSISSALKLFTFSALALSHDSLQLGKTALYRPLLHQFIDDSIRQDSLLADDIIRGEMYNNEEERKKNEAKSTRSGHFNTLPKRPTVDKFKHRSGPKAQKHR